MAAVLTRPAAARTRLSRSEGGRVGLLLALPMLWLGVAYLGALAALLVTSLWSQNDFTGAIERVWTLDNFRDLVTIDVYRTITLRTLGVACSPCRSRCSWPRWPRPGCSGCWSSPY